MASNMSSRSRGCVPLTRNSTEIGTKLDENLNIFKSDRFDADAVLRHMMAWHTLYGSVHHTIVRMAQTESKQMALLANASLLADELLPCAATKYTLLVQLASAEEMRRSVYAITHHSYGGAYTAAISQLMFSVIAQTSTDVHAIFGNALASSAAAKCVQLALGHCSLLEAHGLTLCPVLLEPFRPSVGQALDANLKRIEESTAALAAADD
ncbi:hypothetical protein E3N88_41023 [Mikania micrantha]|uniref:Uncharacterized protein n=1 Tax=Mikania micrantha TaxID=192012 RepID=A0A5N6LPH0_9ASTR|nr:hypothetical protein E3N88_41023 [Mikania micrantha]